MKRTLLFILSVFATVICTLAQVPKVPVAPHIEPTQLQFIENKNQWWDCIRFKTNIPNGYAFFEKNKITYSFIKEEDAHKFSHPKPTVKKGDIIHLHAFNMEFLNENEAVKIFGTDTFSEYQNYFIGNDEKHWASHVQLYKNVWYKNIYNNIDLKYSSIGNSLKYEFEVSPNGNVGDIQLKYNEAGELKLKNGLLHIKTSVNELIEEQPYTYQIINGEKKIIPSTFVLRKNIISFKVADYDHTQPLIIDPVLIFCTYSGSTSDNWGTSATYDSLGNLYAAGIATNVSGFGTGYLGYSWTGNNSGYPTTVGAFQTHYGGGDSVMANWNPYFGDISISKFNSTGTALIYSTFLGGSDNDYANSLIVTPANQLIVFGRSYSTNFPVKAGCYQTTNHGNADIVITKFNAAGSALIGSTYIGGSNADGVNYSPVETTMASTKRNYGDDARGEVNLDRAGNIYIASCSMSSDFPVTSGCYQNTFAGGLQDGVIFKLNPTLTTLTYSTYVGGNLNDACYSLDIDNSNYTAFVTGGTESSNFPSTAGTYHTTYQGGPQDGFLLHLNTAGTALLASTFVGTNQYDQSYFVKLDINNEPYILGQTAGAYPVVGSVYSNPNSGLFISKFNQSLNTLLLSTVIGNGSGSPNISPTAFSVDQCAFSNVYFAGWGGNFLGMGPGLMAGMPLTANAIQTTTDQATYSDFYIGVLSTNMTNLLFGSYYGGNGSIEHVDGGTNRFDKNGFIYGAICAGCGGNSLLQAFPANAYSTTNHSFNCNLAGFKMFLRPPAQVTASPDTFNCKPFLVQFNCNVTVPLYIWNFGDGSPVSHLQNPTHTYQTAGTYNVTLIVHDSSYCNIHDTLHLHVVCLNDSVKALITASDTTVCPNTLLQFNAGNNFPHSYYQWNFGDGSPVVDSQNVAHSYSSTGNYVVRLDVFDSTVCFRHDSMLLTVHIVSTIVSDSFTVNRTHVCGIPAAFTFHGYTNNSSSYIWNFGDGSPIVTNTLNPTHNYNSYGTFVVKLFAMNPNSCNAIDSFSISLKVDSSFFVKAHVSIPVTFGCAPLAVQFSNSSINGVSYYWNFGDGNTSTNAAPAHTYSGVGIFHIVFIATDTNTCNLHDTIYLTVKTDTNRVHATAVANPTTGCSPLTVQFTALNNNAPSLIWNFGNGITSTQTNPVYTYNDTLHYLVTLIATDTTKCNQHDTSTVFIDPYFTQPIAKFAVSDTANCGTLQNVVITNLSIGQTTNSWNFGDGSTSTLQTPPPHNYNSVGNYLMYLIVTNPTDCKTNDTALQMVHVWQNPMASFSISPATVLKSDSLFSFINSSQYADLYDWYVDGVLISNAQDFYQSWHPLGYHKICMVAKTKNSCTDSVCRLIEVFEVPYIGVPNAFSPNNDGENDFFRIYGIGIEEVDFRIYNRWGELVFHTTDRNQGWDGTYKGKPQEMEAYAWTLNAVLISGEKKVMKGNVTLVR